MQSRKKSRELYRLTIAILAIGLVSGGLLVWICSTSKAMINNHDIAAAIRNAEISITLYHLRLEESLSTKNAGKATVFLDEAIGMLDAILEGGRNAGNVFVSEPLSRPLLRSRLEAARSLTMQLKAAGSAPLDAGEKPKAGSGIARHFERTFVGIAGAMKEVQDIVEAEETATERRYRILALVVVGAWTSIIVTATTGAWRLEARQMHTARELTAANEQLRLQSEELRRHEGHLSELVERRTADLTETNERLRIEIAERKQIAEGLKESTLQIRSLSSELINAQEMERRRISIELHDGVGQALNAVKLHIRVIEGEVGPNEPATKQECEKLLNYLDNTIEDVRRISLDLSPPALEDLGLASALQWMVNHLAGISGINITHVISEEIDYLFHQNHWVIIYRIVQEALANIVKHAGAENALFTAEHRNNEVIFFIKDDGHGFNPEEVVTNAPRKRRMGLVTMSERVKMVGGKLDVKSEKGAGTQIVFSIPVDAGGC